VRVFAPAKINLALHVTGRRADGYHLLDSIVVFADLGDRLEIAPSDELALTVTGPRAAGVPADRRNLIWQAAELFPPGQGRRSPSTSSCRMRAVSVAARPMRPPRCGGCPNCGMFRCPMMRRC